jgi:hypothetical protein
MFPAFADVTKFPDASIQMWWTMATVYITDYDNCLISGPTLQAALNLMTAHLAQTFTMIASGAGTGTPGLVTGATEGSVSISMTPPPAKNAWQFWLSSTPYGLQLWALLSSLLVGGITIGGHPERSSFRRSYGVFR